MNLTIDIGNTRAKICLFDGTACINTFDEGVSLTHTLEEIFKHHAIDACAVSCVGRERKHLEEMLKRQTENKVKYKMLLEIKWRQNKK